MGRLKFADGRIISDDESEPKAKSERKPAVKKKPSRKKT